VALIPNARQQEIVRWLQETPTLTIDQLVETLGVSTMTVHRDLDVLSKAGLVDKVHGGVTRAGTSKRKSNAATACALCDEPVLARTLVTLQTVDGDVIHACCAHCGILLLNDRHDVIAALAKDFIYGRMVNLYQAAFIVDSDITLCCTPNVMVFNSKNDANRFNNGFGGTVFNFADMKRYVMDYHRAYVPTGK